MASYSYQRLITYLQGPGSGIVATLQAHCYAAMPGVTAKQCSPARGLYRANGHGANANGHTRYPAQTGKLYAHQLQNAFDATAQGKTKKQVQAHQRAVGGVWAKQRAAAAKGARQAKRAAKPASEPAAQEPTAQEPTAQPS